MGGDWTRQRFRLQRYLARSFSTSAASHAVAFDPSREQNGLQVNEADGKFGTWQIDRRVAHHQSRIEHWYFGLRCGSPPRGVVSGQRSQHVES